MLHFSLPIEELGSHRPRDRSHRQVDRAKGKTLDEISAIVQKINQQLKEKKNKLAPQIKVRLVTWMLMDDLDGEEESSKVGLGFKIPNPFGDDFFVTSSLQQVAWP